MQILSDKAPEHEGVTLAMFQRCLFPRYPQLAEHLFRHFQGESPGEGLAAPIFRQQCDKFLAVSEWTE